jgi:hypothetical protein
MVEAAHRKITDLAWSIRRIRGVVERIRPNLERDYA